MILHGENIKVYSAGQIIAEATSCTIEVDADALEKASSTSARQKDFRNGRTTWRVSINKFVDNMKTDFLMAGQEYILTLYVSNSDMLTGKAICTESRVGGDVGKLAQGFCSFLGNGDLQ